MLLKSKKKKKTLDAANSVVLTTDMWTSRATEAYLTVSCHIIDENGKMQAWVLETSSFSRKQTADNICAELKRVADQWGIAATIQAVITDNANMIAAVHKAGWAHYPCFAHAINVVVKDSIKALPVELCVLHIQWLLHFAWKSSQCLSEEDWSMVGLLLDALRRSNKGGIIWEPCIRFESVPPGYSTSEINCIFWGQR